MQHSLVVLRAPRAALLLHLAQVLLAIHAAGAYQTVVIGEVAQRDTDRPIYEVNFPALGERVPEGAAGAEHAPGVTAMRMVTARGQAMRCLLPAPASASASPAPIPDDAVFDDVDALLSEYENKCFVRLEGWWTYEFCYGKHVVQKHIIPKDRDPLDGEVEETFVLGRLDRELDLQRRKNVSKLATKDATFTQLFVNGTICDKTKVPRRVLVKYICRDDAVQLGGVTKSSSNANINLLKSVREVVSCVYEIEFMNGAICHHSTYKEKLARAARPIHCSMAEDEGPFEGLMSSSYKKASLNL